ncbi:MAG: N-acetylglucosamine kinase [Trebonia sp.]
MDRVTPAAVLAVDGGNSKTDVALIAANGAVLASLRGPGASREHFGTAGAVARLGAMVAEVAAAAGLGDDREDYPVVARHTSACLAGADLPEEEAELAAAIRAQGWSATAAVTNDTFAVLRAGLPPGQTWGVAVTCGAGINCVGVAPDGQVIRYLSFGPLSGDWGGGTDLGAAVLWHAMRAEDGRGQPTKLLAGLTRFFGLPSVGEVAKALRAGTLDHHELRGLTTVLFAAAQLGDPVAIGLVERQADEISLMAVTAMRRIGLDAAPVVLGGGVLEARDPLLTAEIEQRLAVAVPSAQTRLVDAPPVTGAALLGFDHLRQQGADADACLAAEQWLRASHLRPEIGRPLAR